MKGEPTWLLSCQQRQRSAARPVYAGPEGRVGFSYASNGVWSGSSVYSPRKGRSYPAELSVGRAGRLDIKVKDGIFSNHSYWSR